MFFALSNLDVLLDETEIAKKHCEQLTQFFVEIQAKQPNLENQKESFTVAKIDHILLKRCNRILRG